jgi:hypothetical protein
VFSVLNYSENDRLKKYLFETYSNINKLKSNIILYDFIRSFNLNEVKNKIYNSHIKNIDENFNKNKFGYYKVFKTLYNYNFNKIDTNMILFIRNSINENNENYDEMLGFDINDPTETYAINLVEWNELLNYYILQENLEEIDRNRFLTCILYDMTFYGFSEENIKKRRNEIFNY